MFFDYTDGDFCFGSGNTFFDSDGDMMERLSDTTALDLETGEIEVRAHSFKILSESESEEAEGDIAAATEETEGALVFDGPVTIYDENDVVITVNAESNKNIKEFY